MKMKRTAKTKDSDSGQNNNNNRKKIIKMELTTEEEEGNREEHKSSEKKVKKEDVVGGYKQENGGGVSSGYESLSPSTSGSSSPRCIEMEKDEADEEEDEIPIPDLTLEENGEEMGINEENDVDDDDIAPPILVPEVIKKQKGGKKFPPKYLLTPPETPVKSPSPVKEKDKEGAFSSSSESGASSIPYSQRIKKKSRRNLLAMRRRQAKEDREILKDMKNPKPSSSGPLRREQARIRKIIEGRAEGKDGGEEEGDNTPSRRSLKMSKFSNAAQALKRRAVRMRMSTPTKSPKVRQTEENGNEREIDSAITSKDNCNKTDNERTGGGRGGDEHGDGAKIIHQTEAEASRQVKLPTQSKKKKLDMKEEGGETNRHNQKPEMFKKCENDVQEKSKPDDENEKKCSQKDNPSPPSSLPLDDVEIREGIKEEKVEIDTEKIAKDGETPKASTEMDCETSPSPTLCNGEIVKRKKRMRGRPRKRSRNNGCHVSDAPVPIPSNLTIIAEAEADSKGNPTSTENKTDEIDKPRLKKVVRIRVERLSESEITSHATPTEQVELNPAPPPPNKNGTHRNHSPSGVSRKKQKQEKSKPVRKSKPKKPVVSINANNNDEEPNHGSNGNVKLGLETSIRLDILTDRKLKELEKTFGVRLGDHISSFTDGNESNPNTLVKFTTVTRSRSQSLTMEPKKISTRAANRTTSDCIERGLKPSLSSKANKANGGLKHPSVNKLEGTKNKKTTLSETNGTEAPQTSSSEIRRSSRNRSKTHYQNEFVW